MNYVTFMTNSKKKYKIKVEELNEYPRSLLTIMALGPFKGNHDGEGNIKTTMSDNAMKNISQFYKNGVWPNPYFFENKWSLDGVGNSATDFDKICEYLNLPDYIEEEEDEDELWGGMKLSGDQLEEFKREYETERAYEKMKEEQERERELDQYYDSLYDPDDYYDNY